MTPLIFQGDVHQESNSLQDPKVHRPETAEWGYLRNNSDT